MSDTPATLDPASKALVSEEMKSRTDLSQVSEVPVPKGNEPAPPPRIIDQHAARKSLYAKSKGNRDQRIASDRTQHADIDAINTQFEAEAGQRTHEGQDLRGSHFDTERPDPRKQESAPAGAPPSQGPAERVTVKVYGNEYTVPKTDVDEAGGVEAYQKKRAAAIELERASRSRIELERRLQETKRLNEELEAQQRAGQGKVPATKPTGQHAGQAEPPGTGAPGSSADVQAQAQGIVQNLYSGDPKRAVEAVAQIIAASRGQALDPKDVAQQAAALLKEQGQTTGKAPPAPDSEFEVQRRLANEMMTRDYADIIADGELKQLALNKMRALQRDSNNEGRSLVELSREAAEYVRTKFVNPRQGVIERKRSLPNLSSTASGKSPEAAPEGPKFAKNSSYIEELQRRSGQRR